MPLPIKEVSFVRSFSRHDANNDNNDANDDDSLDNHHEDDEEEEDEKELLLRRQKASASAMNLFEKYSHLNKGIEETRNEMKQARLKMEGIQTSMAKTKQEREVLKRDTEVSHRETNEIHCQVDQATEVLFQLEEERSRVRMQTQMAHQALQLTKSFVEEQRRQFLEESRQFRANCKRMRLRASGMGLEYASLRAFATVVAAEQTAAIVAEPTEQELLGEIMTPTIFRDNTDSILRPATQSKTLAKSSNAAKEDEIEVEDNGNNGKSDPSQWIPDPRDEEMKEALHRYRKEQAAYQEGQEAFQDIQSQEKKLREKAASRAQRKEQLLAQLKRIQNDNDEMEKELVDLEEQTKESRELGKAFEKGMIRMNELATLCGLMEGTVFDVANNSVPQFVFYRREQT